MAVKVRGRERVIEITGPGVVGSKKRGPSDAEEILVPYILAQSAVPVILPSSGSSNATGQITLTTALPYQPSGTVQIYLPSGVVTAGSAGTGAGLYPVVFSSTSVCQVQGTGIVTANGAYTQTTTQQVLASVVVPGGAMGANGALRISTLFGRNAGGTGNVNAGVYLDANDIASNSALSTTTISYSHQKTVRNRGSQGLQVVTYFHADGANSTAGAPTKLSVDTSINKSLDIRGTLVNATDCIILEGYTVEVLPSA